MDKELMLALSNLSDAISYLSDTLKNGKKDKKDDESASTKALIKGDFVKNMTTKLDKIEKTTDKILSNQSAILNSVKSKTNNKTSDTDTVEKLGKNKKAGDNFKKGVGVILAIAAAVLAIGVAFKLLGKVNFLTVISLAIALPLLAYAFAVVHMTLKKVGFDPLRDSANFILAITSIALSITVASWILSKTSILSAGKAFSILLISGLFGFMAFGVAKLLLAFKKAKLSLVGLVKTVIFLPLVMIGMSMAITMSSWILQGVVPIGIRQAFSAILISAIFTVLAFGLAKIMKGINKLKASSIGKIPLLSMIFPALATAIVASSYLLQLTAWVSLKQAFSAILISAVFVVLSIGLSKILGALKDVQPSNMLKVGFLPIIFVAMSTAIWGSSLLLQNVATMKIGQFWTSLGITILFAAMTPPLVMILRTLEKTKINYASMFLIPVLYTVMAGAIFASSWILSKTKIIPNEKSKQIAFFSIAIAASISSFILIIALAKKTNINIKDVLIGGALIIAISTAISLSSIVLSVGNYSKHPSLAWALGVGLSILLMTPTIIALGIVAASGVGVGALALGIAMIPIICSGIVVADMVLQKGSYAKYPPLVWATSVSLLLVTFAIATITLGTIALTGIGLVAIYAGSKMISIISKSIVSVSNVISKGNYNKYPPVSWALSISLLIGVMTASIITLGGIVMTGIGLVAIYAGLKIMKLVAQSIVDTAGILKGGDFTGGPTKEWAEGVGLSISAFAPAIKAVAGEGIVGLFKGGLSVATVKSTITSIASGIVTAAVFFNKYKGEFKNPPSKAWAEGVGTAIGAFAPVFTTLSKSSIFKSDKKLINSMVHGIIAVSNGVIAAAVIFAKNKATFNSGYPTKAWGEGVGAAIRAFTPVFTTIQGTKWYRSPKKQVDLMSSGIISLASSMVYVANIFAKATWNKYPTIQWANNVKNTVITWANISKELLKKKIDNLDDSGITHGVNSMVSVAKKLANARDAFGFKIDPDYMNKLANSLFMYDYMIGRLMLTDQNRRKIYGSFAQSPVTKIANGLIVMSKSFNKLSQSINNFNRAINNINKAKVDTFIKMTTKLGMKNNQTKTNGFINTVDNKMSGAVKTVKEKMFGLSPTPVATAMANRYASNRTEQMLQTIINLLNQCNENTEEISNNARASANINPILKM